MKPKYIKFNYKKYPYDVLSDFQFCLVKYGIDLCKNCYYTGCDVCYWGEARKDVNEAFYILNEEIQARKGRKKNKK